MRFFVLACDYDGTLAREGVVSDHTLKALDRLRKTGRKTVLVTGRELSDLLRIFKTPQTFDFIIAENGAVLYHPETRKLRLLAKPVPDQFIQKMRDRGVSPLSKGAVIASTSRPHEYEALEIIQELGLELQIVFNKGAVMILPPGVNKATGLTAALHELKLSIHNVVGVGDAENDHAFLEAAECSVAVSNALDSLKERVHYVTTADHGEGVVELIDEIITNDLEDICERIRKHRVR